MVAGRTVIVLGNIADAPIAPRRLATRIAPNADRTQDVSNWQRNPDIEEFVSQVNNRIVGINSLMMTSADRNLDIAEATRANLFVVAALLLLAATAGSVGETAFQLRS
jgi:hypothetical protein